MNSRLPGRRNISSDSRAGVTLVEMMVAVTILSVAILGLVASFGAIQRSMQVAKSKTLASNLAQEKLHILMQKPYFQVIPTPNPSALNTNYTPNISYDNTYFPIEYILQGGITYERLTYVQVVRENSGVLQTLSPETPDTGMRLLTITVLWVEGGQRKRLELSSVMSNPDTIMGNAALVGTVKIDGTATPISGALVLVAENTGWRDSTDALGAYAITLSPGPGTLTASAPGYHTKYIDVTAVANGSVITDFDLVPIASGTVSGTAWINPGLVISQVVAATNTVTGDGPKEVEYVVLYNPTGNEIAIGSTGLSSAKNVNIAYSDESVTYNCSDAQFGLTHISTFVESGHSYLIANATFFYSNGWITADAYYEPPTGTNNCGDQGVACNGAKYCDAIRNDKAGGIQLTWADDGVVIDKVGWSDADNTAPVFEVSNVNMAATDGLAAGTQLVRITSPTWTMSDLTVYGAAYDSGNNSVDFSSRTALDVPPLTATMASSQTAIAGVPAAGAVVSADDGLSDPTTAYLTGNPPRAVFLLPNVATGTWSVFISSGEHLLQQSDSVDIAATGSTYVFPSSTTRLDEAGVFGFISGTVVDVSGTPLTGITVSPGAAGSDQTTSGIGRYMLAVATGPVDVTANANNANPTYVYVSSSNVTTALGEITSGVNFILSQGGRFSGFVSRDGVNALPGVAVAANDSNNITRDVQVSDINGRFLTINVATGTYELTPQLDSLETSTPIFVSATVTPGGTVDVGTFTVTGALGTISGTVTAGGTPIATGVLIVVTTQTLAGSPPAPPSLSSASLSGASFYIASSREDGNYTVDVRQSTNPVYNIYGFYYATNDSGSDAATSKVATAGVLAGQATGQHNLAW